MWNRTVTNYSRTFRNMIKMSEGIVQQFALLTKTFDPSDDIN